MKFSEKFFTVRMERDWHKFPREAVAVPALEVPMARLDGPERTWLSGGVPALTGGGMR